ncbi:hypothetical protein MAR_021050 [Mya arenaria]|uniref:Uncharacterized protein n=1 Tax=Mya arenaria TaxID=6604 RepID=A0ABY7EET3_MYAAR|nr:hypothetical protein MAR_021050 [Mya arenaria]
MKAVTGVGPDQKLPVDVVFGGSTLLRHQNKEMSQLHYVTGLILDHGGATDEVIVPVTYSRLSVLDVISTHRLPEAPPQSLYTTPRVEAVTVMSSCRISTAVNSLQLPHVTARSMGLASMTSAQLYCQAENPGPATRDMSMPYDIIGDNYDFTVNPNEMTKEKKQRKCLHWFLYCAVTKRVFSENLPDNGSTMDIKRAPCSVFVPGNSDIESLVSDFVFIIIDVVTNYLKFLKPYKSLVHFVLPMKTWML